MDLIKLNDLQTFGKAHHQKQAQLQTALLWTPKCKRERPKTTRQQTVEAALWALRKRDDSSYLST